MQPSEEHAGGGVPEGGVRPTASPEGRMSLVGSLEDLGLGDLLQIVSLTHKSGVLTIRSSEGEGRVLFRNGAIHAAVLKGAEPDLRSVLLAAGRATPERMDAAVGRARREDVSLRHAVVSEGIAGDEEIEALLRQAVERAVLQMFRWPGGEFDFEVDGRLVEGVPTLEQGISAQFLAIEGTRLLDEGGRVPEPASEDDPASFADVARDVVEGLRSGSPEPGAVDEALDLPEVEAVAEEAPAAAKAAPPPAVIAADASLAVLEWIREVLGDAVPRVHLFQRTEDAVVRVRQYLARAEVPAVLLGSEAPGEVPEGHDGVAARLEQLSPRLRVLRLVDETGEQTAASGTRPRLPRPDPARLPVPAGDAALAGLADRLRQAVLASPPVEETP